MSDSCGRCRFFIDEGCRRYPPQLFVVQSAQPRPNIPGLQLAPPTISVNVNATWPKMEADQWCGEFRVAKPPLALV